MYSALCNANISAINGVDAIAAVAGQFARDGAGPVLIGTGFLTHVELQQLVTGVCDALFWLGLFVLL